MDASPKQLKRRPSLQSASTDDTDAATDDESSGQLSRTPETAFVYAGEVLQMDEAFVMRAVQNDGLALSHAHPSLQKDRQIVLAAVRQNGCSLKFAHSELQNDGQIVIAAVKQNGNALAYASRALRRDAGVARAAAEQNSSALRFVDKSLKAVYVWATPRRVRLEFFEQTNREPRAASREPTSPEQAARNLIAANRGLELRTASREQSAGVTGCTASREQSAGVTGCGAAVTDFVKQLTSNFFDRMVKSLGS